MSDYRFFKYRQINSRLLDALRGGTIYFSKQKDLNDPFDCELDIEKAINNAADSLGGKEAKSLRGLLNKNGEFEKFQENVNKLGIFSACSEMNEKQTLLWAHYANNHKGLCLLYDVYPEKWTQTHAAFSNASGLWWLRNECLRLRL